MRLALFLLGLLASGGALAEPDTFGLGSGRSGLLRVTAPDTVINRYARLTGSAAAGTQDLSISDSSGFVAGELVLLHRSTDLSPAPASGDQRQLSLEGSPVGQFEYARVESVAPGRLRLTAPLLHGFTAGVTQVVSVPEYTSAQVLTGATLRAAPWDGSVGGILALLVMGTLTNDGVVSVDGAGFRGGVFLNHADHRDCAGLDQSVATGGSYKGEGLVAGRYSQASGRGNLANGGGGGNCHNAGGGGGGHAGMGGPGARSADGDQDVGGLGGAAVGYRPYERILFGGGGGAGEGNNFIGTSGGAGGGLMLIRAGAMAGSGRFSARGSSADPTPGTGDDGAGGGGGGGAISLRTTGALTCGVAEASGGAGGDATSPDFPVGPGGGGGGGIVLLQGNPITCPAVVLAGAPGVSRFTGDTRGAGPVRLDGGSSFGSEQPIPRPLRTPATPTVTRPANGATDVPRRPRFEGLAEQGVVVHLVLDGAPYARVEAAGEGGSFLFTAPSDLAPGPHELRASAELLGLRSPYSVSHRFDVVTPADGGLPDGGRPDGGLSDGGTEGEGWPILVVPVEGEQVDPTPLIAGTSPSGVSVTLEVDAVEVARVPVDSEGRFHYTLTAAQALSAGAHRVTARAWDEADNPGLASLPTSFEVVPPTDLDVSCGCGASPGAGAAAVVVLLGAWAARRRRGMP
jgi:uncharacterized protein (TIGR03382 family)